MIDKNKNERIIITLTKESLKVLNEIATEECRTKSRQIEKMIRDYNRKKYEHIKQ